MLSCPGTFSQTRGHTLVRDVAEGMDIQHLVDQMPDEGASPRVSKSLKRFRVLALHLRKTQPMAPLSLPPGRVGRRKLSGIRRETTLEPKRLRRAAAMTTHCSPRSVLGKATDSRDRAQDGQQEAMVVGAGGRSQNDDADLPEVMQSVAPSSGWPNAHARASHFAKHRKPSVCLPLVAFGTPTLGTQPNLRQRLRAAFCAGGI